MRSAGVHRAMLQCLKHIVPLRKTAAVRMCIEQQHASTTQHAKAKCVHNYTQLQNTRITMHDSNTPRECKRVRNSAPRSTSTKEQLRGSMHAHSG